MIQKNVESWSQNLSVVKAKRRDIPIIEELSSYTRLPARKDIISRHHTLLKCTKDKNARLCMITNELICLWEKFSFPILSGQERWTLVVPIRYTS